MKTFLSALIALALGYSAQAADVTTKISDVHLCCKSCVNGIEKAVSIVSGAKATVDKDAGTVELAGPDEATVQKAADAIIKAGYFGTSSNSKIKMTDHVRPKGKMVTMLQIDGVHLCCDKCVKALDQALKTVPGVKGHNAVKGAKSFEVEGDFIDVDVFKALEKAGFCGTAA